MTTETLCWVAVGVMAACAVFMVWLVFYVTRAPVMELFCPKCGVVHGHDDGQCLRCGMGVQLCNKKGGGA